MTGEFSNIKIQGMASAVPQIVEENADYATVLGTRRTKKQIKLTGVSKRHIAGRYQRTSDLCYAASVRLMEKLNWNKDEIKVLIYITQGPNYMLPSTAFFLQKRLGIPEDCVCFDINLGCSSFNVGVHVVAALLQSCNVSDKALLLIGDTASKVLDPEEDMKENEIANRMIFGAAGAAIAMEKVKESNLKFLTKSDGNRYDAIIRHWGRGTTMDGNAVLEFAINDVSDDVMNFKEIFRLEESDIDYYVFHQAQKLILDNIIADCDIPEEKELRSLDEYGNTSGTSVPLTVCSNRDKLVDKESTKLLLCGFGVGLSWGMIYAEIPVENILPVIETDEHFDEDKVSGDTLHDCNILVVGADKPMGGYISRYLDVRGASIFLTGGDEEQINIVQSDLFRNSQAIANQDSDMSLFDKIVKSCKENDICLDGIVFADESIEWEIQNNVCLQLYSQGCLKEMTSIVFMNNQSKCSKQDQEAFCEKMRELENAINKIPKDSEDDIVRVNAVQFDIEQLDLFEIRGNGQEWVEKFLQTGCPTEMKRPLYVGEAVTFLLSEQSQYTTGVILPINK